MFITIAFTHAAKLRAITAIIEVARLVVHTLCLAPAAIFALCVAAA